MPTYPQRDSLSGGETRRGGTRVGVQGKPFASPLGIKLPRQRSQGVKATAAAAGRLLPGWRLERKQKEEQEKEGAGGWTRLPATAAAAATWSNRAGRRAPAGVQATARGSRSRILAAAAAAAAAAGPERVPSAERSAAASPRRAGLAPSARTRAHTLTHSHTCALLRSPAAAAPALSAAVDRRAPPLLL